jgi:beta-lactamase class A
MNFIILLAALTMVQTPTALESKVRALIAESGAEVAVAYRTLDGSSQLLFDPDKTFHAASTMKVPVMIELFRQAEAGTVKLDDQLPIRNEFRSIVDGSPYKLSEGDDSDREVYANVGKTMTLRRLNELMITVSSNFATNLLIEKLGAENIRATVTKLGADGMKVLRGVEDSKAFDKGLNNATTARGLLVLFDKIGQGKAVSAAADKEMLEVLKRQKFNEGIPAGVPPGTPVAHKTGSITRIHHDAGIVLGPKPYVLVILVRGIQDQKVSGPLMAAISRAVWDSQLSALSFRLSASGVRLPAGSWQLKAGMEAES